VKIEPSAEKELRQPVTDADLDLLYSLRAKIKNIEEIVKTKLPGKDKIQSIASLIKKETINSTE
jgi:hypothetical protein